MSGPLPLWSHLRAGAVLALAGFMLFMATPLCDTTMGANYATPKQRAAYRADLGILALPTLAAAWINNHGRQALHDRLEVIEQPLALRQYWNLYPGWGGIWRSLEIRVDGEVVFRTQDPERTWLRPQLRQHRIAYQLDMGLKGRRPLGLKYALGWLRDVARRDFPDATRVEFHWRGGVWPGTRTRLASRYWAAAPDWTLHAEESGS